MDKKIIEKISWWIPIKSLRNNFREKFKIEDQTRPDHELICIIDYICFYNNSKYKKIQPMLQYTNAA